MIVGEKESATVAPAFEVVDFCERRANLRF